MTKYTIGVDFGTLSGRAITAARVMGKIKDTVYYPIPENAAVYDRLFKEYITLHDYFGSGGNDVMKRLKAIKIELSK